MTAIAYTPCATLRYQQTADDRAAQDVLDCLARLDWDALQAALDATSGAPVAELDLHDTQELPALPDVTGRDGEHPRWTEAMRQAVSDIDARSAEWSALMEAQAKRSREIRLLADDEWTDELTKADHRF